MVKRDLEQWFFRITRYADELLADLEGLDWPERVKTMQRNWIGRSEGAEFDLVVDGRDGTDGRPPGPPGLHPRPDTSFGMTYAVVAPEHPLVDELTTPEHRAEVEALRSRAAAATEIERTAEGDDDGGLAKRGAATGSSVVNPFTGTTVPVYVADYVLMGYGTGAIMAVPAEDTRDWDFARAHGLPHRATVRPPDGWDEHGGPDGGPGGAYTGTGEKINSAWLDGLDIPTAKARAIEWLESEGIGTGKVNYRLRDWLVSRQRFWGCPIPVVTCPEHGIVPVPEDQLPVLAPDDVEFRPTGSPRWPPTRGSASPPAPSAADRPNVRPTPWTPSWTPRGTSCASLTRGPPTSPSTPRSHGTGCPSTSTSGASSTPSSTCSTPASSPRPWSTWAWPPRDCVSRSPACSPRA